MPQCSCGRLRECKREMSQEMKVQIMSVNLALKRELAYRKKLARLYPNDGSIKHFSPLQVPSAAKNSSPNLGSRHSLGQSSHPTQVHQISISNLSSTLVVEPISMAGVVQQQSVFPNASCPVSDLTKVAPYQAPPLNSNAAATDSTTKEIVTVSASDNTNLFCKVCKVSCSGSFNYKQHVRGQKHKTKLKMQLRVGGNSSGTSHQPRCNLCQIWCTDENSLKLHFDGQKHRAKLKETELHQKGIVLHQQLWCELCQVPCSNEDSFRMHLRGKKPCRSLIQH